MTDEPVELTPDTSQFHALLAALPQARVEDKALWLEDETLFENGPGPSGETGFGECEGCGLSVERVGWDRICLACQEEERELDDERDERLAEEDHFLYGIPWTL